MPEPVFLAANNGDVGGGEQMLLRSAAAARDLGHDVTVVAPANPGDVLAAARADGLAVVAIPAASRPDYLRGLRHWDRGREGLLWCHGLVPALATAGRRRRIVHLHQAPRSAVQRAALEVARRRAVRVVVPSRSMASHVRSSYALPNWTADLTVIPRPAPAHALRVGFLGRLSTDKGLDVLAGAVGVVAADTRQVQLLVAGDTRWVPDDQRDRAATAVSALGGSAVRLGHVPPAELFSQVDLVVFPSRWSEPFGLVVAEAMAAGVPFIISDAGAMPEVAGPDHPWVVPAGDVAALAATIEQVAQSGPDLISNITQTARARWEAEYSPAAGRDRVHQLLTEVIG